MKKQKFIHNFFWSPKTAICMVSNNKTLNFRFSYKNRGSGYDLDSWGRFLFWWFFFCWENDTPGSKQKLKRILLFFAQNKGHFCRLKNTLVLHFTWNVQCETTKQKRTLLSPFCVTYQLRCWPTLSCPARFTQVGIYNIKNY